jgi:amino acid transporter
VVPPIVDPPEVTEPTPAAIDDDPQPPVTPPVTPPGRTTDPTTTPQPDPQPTPTPEPEPTTQELLDSQTGNPLTDIFGGLVPFATGIGAWSLLSLLLSVLAIIITILLFVGLFRRRKNKYEDDKEIEVYGENTEDEKEKRRKANICRLLTMIAGILTPIIWLILDNLNQPMAWINKWTPYVAFIFIVHIVLLIVFKYRSRNRDRDDDIEYVEVDQNTAG